MSFLGESSDEQHDSSDSSDSSYCPLIPLKDIVIPSEFLLPDFKDKKNKEVDEFDIFTLDHRTIKEMWIDIAKGFIRCRKNPLPSDRFALNKTLYQLAPLVIGCFFYAVPAYFKDSLYVKQLSLMR